MQIVCPQTKKLTLVEQRVPPTMTYRVIKHTHTTADNEECSIERAGLIAACTVCGVTIHCDRESTW